MSGKQTQGFEFFSTQIHTSIYTEKIGVLHPFCEICFFNVSITNSVNPQSLATPLCSFYILEILIISIWDYLTTNYSNFLEIVSLLSYYPRGCSSLETSQISLKKSFHWNSSNLLHISNSSLNLLKKVRFWLDDDFLDGIFTFFARKRYKWKDYIKRQYKYLTITGDNQ